MSHTIEFRITIEKMQYNFLPNRELLFVNLLSKTIHGKQMLIFKEINSKNSFTVTYSTLRYKFFTFIIDCNRKNYLIDIICSLICRYSDKKKSLIY